MIHQYELTFTDFSAAQELHVRTASKMRITYWLSHRVMPLVALVSGLLVLWHVVHQHVGFSPGVIWTLGILAWLGFYPGIIRPNQLKKAFRRLAGSPEATAIPVELELDGEELVHRMPGRIESRLRPASILKIVENEEIALLYLRDDLFLFLPKRAVSSGAFADLREWHREAV